MHIGNIETPALVLFEDTVEKNMKMMKEQMDKTGLALRPHYKSCKSTYIAHWQIRAGAKGICCSKVSEAEDLILAGVEDVLLANEVVDIYKIARIAYLAGCCRLTVCVDRKENIMQLQAAAKNQGTTIYVLVEYNVFQRRCGVNTPEEFLELVKAVDSCNNLVFEGIQAYAGHLAHEENYDIRKEQVERVEARVSELKKYLEGKGVPVKEVSGMSTGTVDLRTKDTVFTEAQAGSYIFMDTAYNAVGLRYENSLFVLTQVMSKGEFIVTDAGLKTISKDQTPPVFKDYPDRKVTLSEEHGRIPAEGLDDVKIGDKLLMIPSHCCTTINLHDHIYLLKNDGKVIDRICVTSRGKSL